MDPANPANDCNAWGSQLSELSTFSQACSAMNQGMSCLIASLLFSLSLSFGWSVGLLLGVFQNFLVLLNDFFLFQCLLVGQWTCWSGHVPLR